MKISNQATKNKYGLPSIAPSKRKTKDRHPNNQAYSRNYRRYKKSNNLGKDDFYKRKTKKPIELVLKERILPKQHLTRKMSNATNVARKDISNLNVE